MASVLRDTATFFTEGTASQFQHVLNIYPEVLKLKAETKNKKPEELIKLDDWYQNELPKKIKSRGKDAHCNHEELVQLMRWKQARGKFYPQLNYLIKVNTPRAVMTETKKAFKKLPNLEQAITALSNLKGVGTTMASALLAAAAPEIAPFMADECLLAIPDIEGIDYTTKEYLNFVSHIQNTTERLRKEDTDGTWNPHSVELALWAHFVACELKPELLDGIPLSNGSLGSSENSAASTEQQQDNARQNGGDFAKEKVSSDESNSGVGETSGQDNETATDEKSLAASEVSGSSSSSEEEKGNDDSCSGNLGNTDDSTNDSIDMMYMASDAHQHAENDDDDDNGNEDQDEEEEGDEDEDDEEAEAEDEDEDEDEDEQDEDFPSAKKVKMDDASSTDDDEDEDEDDYTE